MPLAVTPAATADAAEVALEAAEHQVNRDRQRFAEQSIKRGLSRKNCTLCLQDENDDLHPLIVFDPCHWYPDNV